MLFSLFEGGIKSSLFSAFSNKKVLSSALLFFLAVYQKYTFAMKYFPFTICLVIVLAAASVVSSTTNTSSAAALQKKEIIRTYIWRDATRESIKSIKDIVKGGYEEGGETLYICRCLQCEGGHKIPGKVKNISKMLNSY